MRRVLCLNDIYIFILITKELGNNVEACMLLGSLRIALLLGLE